MFLHNYDPLPPDYRRYQEIRIRDTFYLVKKSCNRCYGTGIVGKWCDPRSGHRDPKTGKPTYDRKVPILCKCAIQAVEEEDNESNQTAVR